MRPLPVPSARPFARPAQAFPNGPARGATPETGPWRRRTRRIRKGIPSFGRALRPERRRFIAPLAWPRPPRPRRGVLGGAAASSLGHVLLVLALVLANMTWPQSQQEPQPLPPAAIDVVFESGAPDRPSEPDSQPSELDVAPPPGAPPSVPMPPAPVAPPMPPPTAPPPPQLVQPAAPPAPPRPPEPPRPQFAEATPDLPPPPPLAPAPPPLAPRPPTQGQPSPRPTRPEPQSRPNRLPGIYMPEAFALNRPPSQPAPAQPPGQRRRGLDLSLPSLAPPGRSSTEPQAEVRGANVGPDWRNAFRRWLDEHLRYPREAAEAGEDGTVAIRIVAEPDGRVRGVVLTRGSRSFWLNTRTQHPFRGATLPAFPPGSDPNGVTIDLTVNYVLIRR